MSSGAKRRLTVDQIDDARRRIAAGERSTYVARDLGVSQPTLMASIDPELRERRLREKREAISGLCAVLRAAHEGPREFRMTPQELDEVRRNLPDDRRDLTGRICGDPIPGFHRVLP
jgi:hypothetical protein